MPTMLGIVSEKLPFIKITDSRKGNRFRSFKFYLRFMKKNAAPLKQEIMKLLLHKGKVILQVSPVLHF